MPDGENIDKGLDQCEKYIYRILKINQITHIRSIFKLWEDNKYAKLINLPFLKKKIWGFFSDTILNTDNVENVIITARYAS